MIAMVSSIDNPCFHCNNSFQQTLKILFMVKIMRKPENIEQKARDALSDCLQDIPFLCVESWGDSNVDLNVAVLLDGAEQTLLVEAKNNGEPRYARQAVNQLLRKLQNLSKAYGVFIAPYISHQAAKICRNANIGYIDFAGNCMLSFGKVYIQIEGKPNPFTQKRILRSLYSPKSERILRVMLASGPREWKVIDLAKEAVVSLGLISNVKKILTDREWVDSQTIGFSLSEPFSLLEEWSQNYSYRQNQVASFYTMLPIPAFESRLEEVCQTRNIPYGLTGFSGATRLAPMVCYQQAMAYVVGDLQKLANLLEIKPVTTGANVVLMIPYDEGVLYNSQKVDGVRVVSPVQMYLDLHEYRGRGEEAAQALFDEILQTKW